MKNVISMVLFLSFFSCQGQEKNMKKQEELIDAYETMRYIVEQEGYWFYSGAKHLNFEQKEIKHTIGDNTISILNIYPITSEGLQGDVDIIQYNIKRDTSNQITLWKSGSPIKQSDKIYDKILLDVISTSEKLRHHTFDHFLLEPKQQVSANGLILKLDSRENNSSTVIVSHQNKTDTLTISNANLYNSYFEGFYINWDNPNSTVYRLEYSVIKRHKLPVWNYFLESKFDPNSPEVEKKMKTVYEVAHKRKIPINVHFIVSSLSHDPEIQKNNVVPIIKQNQKTFAIYEKYFGKDWKKHFDEEVEKIIME